MSYTHLVFVSFVLGSFFQFANAKVSTEIAGENPSLKTENLKSTASEEEIQKVEASQFLNKIKFSKKRLQSRKMGLTSKVTHNKLEKAYRYIRLEKYQPSIEIFLELLKSTQHRPDEHAQIWQQLGFVLAQKGDYANAVKSLTKALEINVLPYSQSLSSIYTLAQLYSTQEKYADACVALKIWMDLAEQISPESMVMMANVLAQLGKKSEALKYVNQAIIDSERPQEKWLQFALALNHELGQFQNSLKLLIHLTSLYPQHSKYWKQLAGTYLSLNDDKKALATMELAYKQGYLMEESDLINLASLYIYLDMPRIATEILEKEIKLLRVSESPKNLEILSQGYLLAREREKSLMTLNKAASKSSSGDSFSKIGMLHLENEEWEMAISAFNKSIDRGTKAPGRAYWGMAIARYQQKDLPGALKTLMRARSFKIEDKGIDSLMEQVKNEMVLLSQNSR